MSKLPFHSPAFKFAAPLLFTVLIPGCSIVGASPPASFYPDYVVDPQKGHDPLPIGIGNRFRLKENMFAMHNPGDLLKNKDNWLLLKAGQIGAPTMEDYEKGTTHGARLVSRNSIIRVTAIKVTDGYHPEVFCSIEGVAEYVSSGLLDYGHLNKSRGYDYDRKLFSRIGGTERR